MPVAITRRDSLAWLLLAGLGRPGPGWRGMATTTGLASSSALTIASAAQPREAGPPSDEAGPLWQAGRPTELAFAAAALLHGAADQGLEPGDYAATALTEALQAARQGDPLAPAAATALQARLLGALRQYLLDLRLGRLDGRTQFKRAGGTWPAPAWSPEPWLAPLSAPSRPLSPAPLPTPLPAPSPAPSALAAPVALAALPAAAWPPRADYAALQAALPPLRALADHPAWASPLPPAPRPAKGTSATAPVPGDGWAGWPQVAARLRLLGDLGEPANPGLGSGRPTGADAEAALPAGDASAALSVALRQFQHRHGLAIDGRFGPATRSALEVPPAARAAQVALGLERLRWQPQPAAARWLEVNLAAFSLRMVERIGGQPQACGEMPVIVGQARGHATPQLLAEVQAIEFSPYWNVPPSIARAELVPQLRRDPGLAARLGYEAVLADGRLASAADPAVLAAVLAGQARLRQRPGERNALGGIKFVFPNADHIYLHHTPSVGLFERARRDFSHGCVRVQDPLAIALFLLRDQPDWPAERVRAAMAAGESRTLRLATAVPIVIGQQTAFIGADGLLHLRADLYGRDAALADSLRQRTHGRLGGP